MTMVSHWCRKEGFLTLKLGFYSGTEMHLLLFCCCCTTCEHQAVKDCLQYDTVRKVIVRNHKRICQIVWALCCLSELTIGNNLPVVKVSEADVIVSMYTVQLTAVLELECSRDTDHRKRMLDKWAQLTCLLYWTIILHWEFRRFNIRFSPSVA